MASQETDLRAMPAAPGRNGPPYAPGHPGPAAPARLLPAIHRRVTEAWTADTDRGMAFLLAPVLFCAGAVAYFSFAIEPPAWIFAGALAMAALFAMLARGRTRLGFVAASFIAAGGLAGQIETWRASTAMLGSEVTTRITGMVERVERQANGRVRVTLALVSTERPELRYPPGRVRVTAASVPEALSPGELLTGVARLRPPSGPVLPGTYDFAFESYMEGIGANGFFLGAAERVAGGPPPVSTLGLRIERLRLAIAERVGARLDGAEGQIAAALISGVRAGIPESVNEQLRISGLAHVLSISGLHMALVAGTVMFAARGGLALFPVMASRHPIRKWAAAAALLAAFVYLMISGAQVAAQRSFIMIAVMLVALLFDRAAITMRNLAIAAMIVAALAPHEVMGPSFQMSFAATAALIAAYGAWARWRIRRASNGPPRLTRRALGYLLGLAATSIVAGTATALYGAWHFHRISTLGLVANLAAMPAVSILVMPAAVLAGIAMPFGLEGPALDLMAFGIRIMLAVAEKVTEISAWDTVGQIPAPGVVAFTIALALVTVSVTNLRWLAVPFIALGTLALAGRDLPRVLVSEDARLVAVRASDGALLVNRARPNSFTVTNWQRAMAAQDIRPPAPASEHDPRDERFACEGGICIARLSEAGLVVHAERAADAEAYCRDAAVIVVVQPDGDRPCRNTRTAVLTGRDLARRGSAAVRMDKVWGGDAPSAEIIQAIGEPYRPWHEHRRFARAARGLPPPERRSPQTDRAADDAPVDTVPQ